jgi:threonyl-tRNA synthetase
MGFIMMWILKIRKSLMLISKKIEDRVLEIKRKVFKLRPVSKEALELYKDNVYKTELITNLEDGTITCIMIPLLIWCGGHIPNTRNQNMLRFTY